MFSSTSSSSNDNDNCQQLVAGNYDVIINDSICDDDNFKKILTDYLEHFQSQEQEWHSMDQSTCGYMKEFKLLKELSRRLKEDKSNLVLGELDVNQKKNRYKDIIPFSHTRVILCNPNKRLQDQASSKQPLPPTLAGLELDVEGGCYINANYIQGPSGSQRAYIACQGPLPCTLIDFWRMIWECNVSVVIMACNEYESGKPKCELYWLDELEKTQLYGNIQVTLKRVRQINDDFLIRKFSVQLLEPERAVSPADSSYDKCSTSDDQSQSIDDNNNNNNIDSPPNNMRNEACNAISISTEAMTNNSNASPLPSEGSFDTSDSASANSSSSPSSSNSTLNSSNHKQTRASQANFRPRAVLAERTICQFHYTTWPDHGVPDSVGPILDLVRLVREVQPTEEKPILVHCSAGCGRTGTICCIDYVWELLRSGKLDKDFNLCRIISHMRQQRMAMVQTLEQYILCHRAVAALFIQQLQLIDANLTLSDSEAASHCNEDFEPEQNVVDQNEARANEEDDAKSVDSDQELGPVFI